MTENRHPILMKIQVKTASIFHDFTGTPKTCVLFAL
jgi:hypothetical protein